MLRSGIFDSLKPKDQMQAIVCDKVIIDVWRLRKVLAFEQGAMQLEILNLDASDSSVELIRRESLIRDYENHKAEWTNLNQLKKWLSSDSRTIGICSMRLTKITFPIYDLRRGNIVDLQRGLKS